MNYKKEVKSYNSKTRQKTPEYPENILVLIISSKGKK